MILERLKQYAYLMRLHKPIGILLLLWPTLWALWLASSGKPESSLLLIFVAGVILMRSAGCIINDFADRHFDGHIRRTRDRPLVSGKVSVTEALILFVLLCLLAFFPGFAFKQSYLDLRCDWCWFDRLLSFYEAIYAFATSGFRNRFYLGCSYGIRGSARSADLAGLALVFYSDALADYLRHFLCDDG